MTKIISLINHKGGVGKTTSTHNLGKAFALAGKRVLLVDNDPQANLSTACGIDNPDELKSTIYTAIVEGSHLVPYPVGEGLDLIPSELDYTNAERHLQSSPAGYFKLRNALKDARENYDYILIDCPPSLGMLTYAALTASDYVIIIAQSTYLSIKGLQTIVNVVEEVRESTNDKINILGFAITQVNRTVVRRQMSEVLKKAYPNQILEPSIRQNVSIEEAITQQLDIFSYAPESAGAEDYKALAGEIMHKIENS